MWKQTRGTKKTRGGGRGRRDGRNPTPGWGKKLSALPYGMSIFFYKKYFCLPVSPWRVP